MSTVTEAYHNELPENIRQLELRFDQPLRPRGPNFTAQENKLVEAAAEWAVVSGATYRSVAQVLAELMGRPVKSLEVKLSRVGPGKNRR